jgi:hypothetical protein
MGKKNAAKPCEPWSVRRTDETPKRNVPLNKTINPSLLNTGREILGEEIPRKLA